ncbi:MAG: sugar phosphate isomerase/epimerase family protein [Planctomycetaceae bacterium]
MIPKDVTRRRFLKTAAAVAGTTVPGLSAAPEGSNARVSFGFSLYGMRSLSVARALRECATIGYDGVELVATKGWPCDPQALARNHRRDIRKQLADTGLQVSALMENLRLVVDAKTNRGNLDRLKRAAELGHEVSPKNPPVIETVLGGRPKQWDALKGKMATALEGWAKAAEAARTVVAVKAHVGGALHHSKDARKLVESVGSRWIRLAYDYSHFQLWDETLDDSLKTAVDRTVFIHVKDSKGKRGKFRFLLPGEGSIDYAKYFALLKRYRYGGPLVVEVSGQIHGRKGYDPIAAAKTSYANLATKLKAAGLRG